MFGLQRLQQGWQVASETVNGFGRTIAKDYLNTPSKQIAAKFASGVGGVTLATVSYVNGNIPCVTFNAFVNASVSCAKAGATGLHNMNIVNATALLKQLPAVVGDCLPNSGSLAWEVVKLAMAGGTVYFLMKYASSVGTDIQAARATHSSAKTKKSE